MGQPGLITMSMRELDRLKVVEAVIEQRLMPRRSAERLGISRRHIERLVARYRAAGPVGLISLRRGHASNHQLAEDLAHRALSLIRERYADFGPTLACEKLWEWDLTKIRSNCYHKPESYEATDLYALME